MVVMVLLSAFVSGVIVCLNVIAWMGYTISKPAEKRGHE